MRKSLTLISVMLVLIGLLLSSCEMANAIFATPTPTSTNTPTITPSPTVTPSPTATNTPTPTFTPTPIPTGVTTEVLQDSSTVFTDYDNKYQFTLPASWIVIPLSMDDIADRLDEVAASNPELSNTAETFRMLDPELVRVVALNEDPQYLYNGFATNISVVAFDEPLLVSMPVAFVTAVLEDNFAQGGATVLTEGANIIYGADGIEVGVIETEMVTPTASGTKITIQSKYLVFQAGGKLMMIQVATPKQFSKEMFAMMDTIGKSVSALK